VSKVILEAAGLAVASSAAALGTQPHKGYIFTRSGDLRQCKWIVHVTGPKQPACIKKIVLDVLQACEKQKVSSVTFPALGTGAGGLAASTVADAILDGLVEFIKSKSVGSLQTVKVVLFQQHMLNDFYMSMKKREGTALPEAKSFLTRLTSEYNMADPERTREGKKHFCYRRFSILEERM
ncbi:PREDICTED: poly [ADP-ribose] polymerase 15-like, partial [Nanorana parkeri]|uniref:poly [ADP-ribose] polymerase 15-like n=1 Tax=Nanorana parkeri TaxID=125878 RepID=UPI0008543C89